MVVETFLDITAKQDDFLLSCCFLVLTVTGPVSFIENSTLVIRYTQTLYTDISSVRFVKLLTVII